MICRTCQNETDGASLFCHVCDSYRPDPAAGRKANVGVRLLAHFLDAAIGLTIFLTVALVSCGMAGLGAAGVSATNGDSQSMASAGVGGALGIGTFFMAIIGYIVILCFFLARGKTPGKAIMGVRVADKSNGNLPGLGRMLLRETLGKFVSGLFLGIGYFWAIFDRDSQAWHDKIAGTVVVRVNPVTQMLPVVTPGTSGRAA